MHSFLGNKKVVRLGGYTAGGFSDNIDSEILDTNGFDSVTFIANIGTITATGTATVSIRDGNDDGLNDAKDVDGSEITYTASDGSKVAIIEIYRPAKRYAQVRIARATANVVIESATAILRDPTRVPVVQDDPSIQDTVFLSSPADS